MTDPDQSARWQEWVEHTARDLGVDPDLVDIASIHELTRVIAHDLDRPLAPVGAYLLGLAVGARGPQADREALARVIEASVAAQTAHWSLLNRTGNAFQ